MIAGFINRVESNLANVLKEIPESGHVSSVRPWSERIKKEYIHGCVYNACF